MREADPAPSAIALLEAQGELVVEQGQFTLDGAAARAKLADFRLADGHGWVLLVVEAANLLDATRVEFEIDNAVTRANIVGAELEHDELERLFDAVFAERGNPRVEARHSLAVACDAAASLDSRVVQLRSKRLSLTFEGEVEPTRASVSLPGGRIELEVRDTSFGARLTTVGPLHETGLLRTQACFSTVPVSLDDQQISEGFSIATGIGPRPFGPESGPGRGLVAWDGLGERRGIHLLANGVVIEEVPGTKWKPNVVAIVDASALGRDLSRSRFVRDDAYASLIATAQAAHDRFELTALDHPRVRGTLAKATDPVITMIPWAYVACCVSIVLVLASVALQLGPIAELLVPLGMFGIFASIGFGALGYSRLPRAPGPTEVGAPALARIEHGPMVVDELGPVRKVRFSVWVFSTARLPFEFLLETYINGDQLDDYERGDWLWVHLPAEGYSGLFFDTELSHDRPRGALGRRKGRKALAAAQAESSG